MESLATPAAASSTTRRDSHQGFDLKNPLTLNPGGRVRIIRGPLVGLTGVLVEQDVSSRWLVQADYAEGVFVRADATAVELL